MKSVTVLKIKVVDGDSDLERIAILCRKARNIASTDWLLRQNGMPESDRQSRSLIKRKGVAVDKPKSESTKLYHAIVEKVPELGTFTVPKLAAEVNAFLSSKVDWRRGMEVDGRRAKRKDAILAHEDRPPFFTAIEIPLHNQQCDLRIGDDCTLSVRRLTRDEPVINLRLSLRRLPPALKRILLDLATGSRKLPDSKLLCRKGEWFWFVPVASEQPQANSEEFITLFPVVPSTDGDRDRPFRVESGERTRGIGDGRYLLRQTLRMESLMKQIGWRYRQRRGTGHGRKKIDRAVMLRRTRLSNIVGEVRRSAIRDIVNFARKEGAGIVVYREPTGVAKEKCWFTVRELTWDWTRFASDLKNSLAKHGIALEVKKLRIGEIMKSEKEKSNEA